MQLFSSSEILKLALQGFTTCIDQKVISLFIFKIELYFAQLCSTGLKVSFRGVGTERREWTTTAGQRSSIKQIWFLCICEHLYNAINTAIVVVLWLYSKPCLWAACQRNKWNISCAHVKQSILWIRLNICDVRLKCCMN